MICDDSIYVSREGISFTIEKRGDKYCLISKSTGETIGCHDTEEGAINQEQAIKAHQESLTKDPFISIEQVEVLCQPCAEEMKRKNLTAVRLSKLNSIFDLDENITPPNETSEVNMVKENEAEIQFAKKPIQMPICYADAGKKTVDGRDVTQELIDGLLSYDATKRRAIVSLNKEAAHGEGNSPVLGKVEKVFEKDGMIIAQVLPVKGYEDILPALASEQYPDRSIEADRLNLDGSDSKQLYLEAIRLCGSERPALNLPPVTFTSTGNSASMEVFNFSIVGSAPTTQTNGGQIMSQPETNNVQEPVKMVVSGIPIEKQLETTQNEFAKTRQEVAELRSQLIEKDLKAWVNSAAMSRKIPTALRDDVVNTLTAVIQKKDHVRFSLSDKKEDIPIAEAFKKILEALPNSLLSAATVGDGISNQFPDIAVSKQEKERIAVREIQKYGREHGLNMLDPLQYTKAEEAVKRERPELWEVR